MRSKFNNKSVCLKTFIKCVQTPSAVFCFSRFFPTIRCFGFVYFLFTLRTQRLIINNSWMVLSVLKLRRPAVNKKEI